MSIIGTDPFDTLIYQQQLIATPLSEDGADGASPLDVAQRSVTIGEPIPIVFGRRIGIVGGVLISPGATEARFENDTVNAVTATYELVLGEGTIPPAQVRDIFQRSCRVGTFSQSFGRRAGTWTPGNFIVPRSGYTTPECPYYCGSGGTYDGMTTGSFVITAPNGDTRWNRQVHIFIRNGMEVVRLLDATNGPSNNIADLLLYLLRKTSRVPADLIDTAAFTAAASFTDQLQLWCNGEFKESSNFEDFLASRAKYFLLAKAKRNGKTGLRPLLPTTSTGALNLAPIRPVFLFDESNIKPGSFELSLTPLGERKPFCALMLWRQQPDNDIGLIRTTELRYPGTALDGPYEQHDLSEYGCSEIHAVRAGAYLLAFRRYVTHTLTIKPRPAVYMPTLKEGDVVEVKMQRNAANAIPGVHNFFYEVSRIGKARTGEVTLNLTHFPVDEQGRSLVALDVAAASGGGVILATAKSGTSCDVNSDADTTTAPDNGTEVVVPPDSAFDGTIDGRNDFGTGGSTDDGFGSGTVDTSSSGSSGSGGNPGETADNQEGYPPHITSPSGEVPREGVALDPQAGICGAGNPSKLEWFKNGVKFATLTYPPGTGSPTVTYYSGVPRPAWLGSLDSPGILLIQAGDGDVYTSVVTCFDGRVFGSETTVQPGRLSRTYSVLYKVSDNMGGSITAGPSSIYSYDKPPIVVFVNDINGIRALGYPSGGGAPLEMGIAGGFAGPVLDAAFTAF